MRKLMHVNMLRVQQTSCNATFGKTYGSVVQVTTSATHHLEKMASKKKTKKGVMTIVPSRAIHTYKCSGSKNAHMPRFFNGACTRIANAERCVARENLIPRFSRSVLAVIDETPMSHPPRVTFSPAKASIMYEKPPSPKQTRSKSRDS